MDWNAFFKTLGTTNPLDAVPVTSNTSIKPVSKWNPVGWGITEWSSLGSLGIATYFLIDRIKK